MIIRDKDILLTDRLELKYSKEFAKIANDRTISENIASHSYPYPYTVKDAEYFFTKNRTEGKRKFIIDFLIFVDKKICGVIGLQDINYTDRNCHIGYWIGNKFRGKKIATRSVSLVSRYAEDRLSMHRLYTRVLETNIPSMKVLLNNNYQIEGYLKDQFFQNGKYFGMFLFSRTGYGES